MYHMNDRTFQLRQIPDTGKPSTQAPELHSLPLTEFQLRPIQLDCERILFKFAHLGRGDVECRPRRWSLWHVGNAKLIWSSKIVIASPLSPSGSDKLIRRPPPLMIFTALIWDESNLSASLKAAMSWPGNAARTGCDWSRQRNANMIILCAVA